MPRHPLTSLALLAIGSTALWASAPAFAGPFDGFNKVLDKANEAIDGVDRTREDTKSVVDGTKDLVKDTERDVKSVVPEPKVPDTRRVKSRTRTDETRDAVAVPAPPSARSAAPAATEDWTIDIGDGETLSVDRKQLDKMIRGGLVDAKTPVYAPSLGRWTPAGEVPALSSHF